MISGEIAGLLPRCGLFRGFDQSKLATLVAATEEVAFPAAADIVHEGESGDAMFVVVSGAVQVYTRGADGHDVTLARLETGDYFGEQSLLPGSTGRRNASIRAVENVRLTRVPKAAFQAVLAEDDALRERLVEIGAEQVRNNLQQLSPLARGIGLDNAGTLRRTLAAGEVLFRQDDEADALYFVTAGRLDAWREEDGERTLIGYTERGGSVGELALVRKSRRAATVIAKEPSEVIAVPRAAFEDVYQESAAVREHLATLHRAYELPQRGIVTQHTGTFAGHDCITTLYHLTDGAVFAAYRVIGESLYAVERLGVKAVETLSWSESARSRELRLDDDGTVTGLTSRGEWADVHNFHKFVLDGGRLTPGEREQFLRSGRFDIEAAIPSPDVVCHCVNVTNQTLRTCITQGATTFTALQKATGCGTVCGSCVPVVAEMLGLEEWVLADITSEYEEAPGIRSFELTPRETSYPSAQPGQHVVVEGVVKGLRLRRPYTLSSAGAHGGHLRITVKMEERGAFSRWLFEERRKDQPLRITRPRGDYVVNLAAAPVICMVAGIGVTPAVAAALTATSTGNQTPMLIHYSGRFRDHMACIRELEAAAGSNIEIIVRETGREGRVDLAEITRLADRFPNADWYLCGPQPYLDEVRTLLKQAGVGIPKVHVEAFTAVGSAPKLTSEERAAVTQYLLVPPKPAPRRPLLEAARKFGCALGAIGNHRVTDWRIGRTQFNPLRLIENKVGRAARVDMPIFEYMAIPTQLGAGPWDAQMLSFARRKKLGDENRERSRQARLAGKPLPGDTPDGDTFAYWVPAVPFPPFPKHCTVETGWTKAAPGKVAPIYITRSRSALEHLLRHPDHTDRGPLPYHFLQQVLGGIGVPACPGRKSSGLFAGQFHDNATWTEHRELATAMFGFSTIDNFSSGVAAAADDICKTIDDVLDETPEVLIDLNVLLSKVGYTVIIRSVFGNVDLAEMHELGLQLSESLRKSLTFVHEFVMGRQSVPPEYVKALEDGHNAVRKIVDVLRETDRQGKLTDAQRSAPIVKLILDTANEPDGNYDRLYSLVLPVIIAGHETTGHTMSWAFYEMAKNPKLEAAVLEEVENFRAARPGRPVTTADYDERPLAWALLAECLRRHSPAGSVPRTTLEDGEVPPNADTGIGGFKYPAGAMFVFSIIGIHMDSNRWQEPEAFRIERWLENVKEGMTLVEKGQAVRAAIRAREKAFDWLPFADGPGRCVGLHFNAHEFLMVLDMMLPRYHFELAHPEYDAPHSRLMLIGPEQGTMAVRIRRRAQLSIPRSR